MNKLSEVWKVFGRNRVQEAPDAWRELQDAPEAVAGDSRLIYGGKGAHGIQPRFCSNSINTAKYNVITFLPIFLFTMFSRVAYLYFLSQCALAYWSTISPFSPYGPTIAICFVLLVAAVKAIVEDKKRHDEDRRTNNSQAHLVQENGSVKDVKWRDVKVGQILEVRDNETFPADLLCLSCKRPDGVAYIRTTNLDGESNLKIRRPVNLKQDTPTSAQEAVDLRCILTCEPPNPDLHNFLGKLTYASPTGSERKIEGLTMNEVLLRGCTLKNSGHIHGLVIYTGPETRIQQNAAAPPRKLGSYDGFLNVQIIIMLAMQIMLCLGCAIGSYVWRQSFGKQRYYLALDNSAQGNYTNGWAYVAVTFLTFWILFSYIIPISLFVTMEIIKYVLSSIFITFDPHMRDRIRREYPKARNSDIIEDLGLVDYVFSDKTGTLTSNEMQLRLLTIKSTSFGVADFKLEKQALEASRQNLHLFDEKLAEAVAALEKRGFLPTLLAAGGSPHFVMASSHSGSTSQEQRQLDEYFSRQPGGLPPASPERPSSAGRGDRDSLLLGHHLVDLWTCLCVCHNLITEEAKDGLPPAYQGPSPDEVALVEGGRQLGFQFVERSRDTLALQMLGHTVNFQILNTLDYSSARARMSVVARAPDGTIRLYSKGADNVMLARLRAGVDKGLVDSVQENLRLYSIQGLRTLLVCSRVISEEEWTEFNANFQEAASSIEDREQRLAVVAESIEMDFELVGATAIEDKLQEGVPATISSLVRAGIKVVMITGDKQETAINIATSCKLIGRLEGLLLCNSPFSRETARAKMEELIAVMGKLDHAPSGGSLNKEKRLEMVIDGMTLARILGGREEEMMLAAMLVRCSGVVVCRASPAQKAGIVDMMKRYHALKEAGEKRTGISKYWRMLTSKLYAGLTGRHAGSSMRMLAIGDGANDVAMIQAAHIGVGIMGHEGRQATNNSDFAISQFRFLSRLLLVHGSLTTYRLARLIKYSFYKNACFAFMLFFYQIFCGFSGQALLDGITAAFYNAAFTALPVAAFAIFDRPVQNLDLLAEHPESYNRKPKGELTARSFWKTGIAQGICHGAIVFFVPYLSTSAKGSNTTDDVFSVGKTMFIALIGTVTLEIALVSRFWTRLFALAWSLSYLLTLPWLIIIPLLYQAFGKHDVAQSGVGNVLMGSPTFWFSIILVYFITFSLRLTEKAICGIWAPSDWEILAEHEHLEGKKGALLSEEASSGHVELQKMGKVSGEVAGNGLSEDPEAARGHRSHNSSDRRWLDE